MSSVGISIVERIKKEGIFLIIYPLTYKIILYIFNQISIRHISPSSLGIFSYLEFIQSVILFCGKEGVRLSVQRLKNDSFENDINNENTERQIINFGIFSWIVAFFIFLFVVVTQSRVSRFREEIFNLEHFKTISFLTIALTTLDLAAEPMYLVNQVQLNFRTKIKIETLSFVVRCIVTFILVNIISIKKKTYEINGHYDSFCILALVIGHFSQSLIFFSSYFYDRMKSKKTRKVKKFFVLKKCTNNSEIIFRYLDRFIFGLWRNMFVQIVFKKILTSTDDILLTNLFSAEDQGLFSFISNHCSIIARVVFFPIEDFVRMTFGRLSYFSDFKSNEVIDYVFTFYLNFTLIILLGLFTNMKYMLELFLNKNSIWIKTDATSIFPKYVLYMPFMAFNGILESLFTATASGMEIKRYSFYMSFLIILILIFLYVGIKFFNLGLDILIISNCFNMLLRIIFCSQNVKRFYEKNMGAPISFFQILTRKKKNYLIFFILAFIQYFFVLDMNLYTRTFIAFMKSCMINFLALILLLIIERKKISMLILNYRK